jgi:hypothetical protein
MSYISFACAIIIRLDYFCMLMLFVWSYMSWSIIFGHTVFDMQKESNCLDYWCIIWVYLFFFYIPDMPNKRSKSEIVAARARIELRTIIIERVVVRQDVMVSPFDFMDHIFQENKWQRMYTCNTVYPRFVREFYGNLKIDHIEQIFPILKTKVRGHSITVDPKLISNTTHIPLIAAPGLPYPNSVDPPSMEDLRLLFDPQGVEEWHEEMRYIPIGWLQSHHRLLARIMM